MRKKRLNNAVIIPDDLYVRRDADRQLEEVITEMQKPGYISVARQMGKTNLLVHTKRRLENAECRYVFIDTSVGFASARECFKYIIDQIISSNKEIEGIKNAAPLIEKRREGPQRGDAIAYQYELMDILNTYEGRIIIFLDEIDSLAQADYSDTIFAHIRRIYFERENSPFLQRISYVLCGAFGDPTKLIKSRNYSAFNISITITLDDFTPAEFEELVFKSQLPLEEVKSYIYAWLKGNPRMTYDVLSKLEDEYLKGETITEQLIDDVIYELYLRSFKHPPIDHIRELVRQNKDIRKFILSIKRGTGEQVPSDILDKLYLFGIVSYYNVNEKLAIKNKIIDKGLSFEWLEQLDDQKKEYQEFEFSNQLLMIEDDVSISQNLVKHLDLGDLISQVAYITEFNILHEFLLQDDHNRVFIVDINLGTGREEDGLFFIKEIRSRCPGALIIVYSAYSFFEERCRVNGADYFYTKGGYYEKNVEEIRKLIVNFVENKGGGKLYEYYAEVADIDKERKIVKLDCYIGEEIIVRYFPLDLIAATVRHDLFIDTVLKIRIVEKGSSLKIMFENVPKSMLYKSDFQIEKYSFNPDIWKRRLE